MKGVFAFLYLFAILVYLLTVFSIYLSMYEKVNRMEYKLFVLEDRVSRELELKHAIKNTIGYSEQIKMNSEVIKIILERLSGSKLSDEIIDEFISKNGISRLKDLESTGSYDYSSNFRNLNVHFWCGYPDLFVIKDIISIKNGKPEFFNSSAMYQRPNVFRIDDEITISSGSTSHIINKCSAFVSSDLLNKISTVSNPDQSIATQLGLMPNDYNNIKFGVMVYDKYENISSAVIIPYSTMIVWHDLHIS